jgi:small subunit ribosomal protein S20
MHGSKYSCSEQILINLFGFCFFNKKPNFAVLQQNKVIEMANHKSAKKRIKSSEVKRLRNRYQHKTTRTYLKKLRESTDKVEAEKLLKEVTSMLDKLSKRNIIHKKKAANLKSSLTKQVAIL